MDDNGAKNSFFWSRFARYIQNIQESIQGILKYHGLVSKIYLLQ